MEIAYTFTEQDVVLFYREFSADWRESKRERKQQNKAWAAFYYFLLLVVPVLVCVATAWVGAGYDTAVVAGLSTGVAWYWPLGFLWSVWQKNRLRATPQFVGPHIVSTSPKGLGDQRPQGEWVAYWSHLADIRKTKNFFLFIYQNKSVVPIPRRAFQSSEEADLFYQMSREHWKRDFGVWPPAPRSGNSGEPGDGRQG